MKEVCAGLGGISVGFAATGGRTSAFVDRTDLSCNALQLNSGLVINGDLSCRHVRIRLHEVEPHSAFILSAGIPCQGYSRQGNGLGFQDPRSQTLLHILQCAWHTQAAAIVLECVVEIQASAEAMQCLCDFASRAGYVLHQVRLELSDQWCTRRHRWWGVLLPQHLPQPHMQPWPAITPSLVVGDVIPEWPLWSPLDEAQLLWTEEEAQAYADPRLGTEPRILNVAGKAPTALHSYGNPLQGCPCRCRLQGFSLTRLYNRGLRGYAVPASHSAGTRYLHPQELGLLNTIPLTMRHVPEHPAALCLIGQLAAPLQSLWIGGQIRVWASEIYQMLCEPPLQMLEGFRSQLLQQRMDLWLLPSMLSGGEFALSDHSGLRTIQSSGPVQVGQLLQAEAAFLEPGFKLQLWYEERHLLSEAFIHFESSQAYSLVQVRKRQAVTSPAATTRGGQPTSVASPASLPQPVDEMVPSPSTASTDVALLVGLLCLQQQTPAYRSLILPPLSMEGHAELLAASPETAAAIRSAVSRGILVLVPFHHDHHWALLAFPSLSDQETQIHLLDGIPGRSLLPGQQLVDLLSHCVPSAACRLLEVTLWTQVDSQSCGAIVLAHAAAYLQKGPSPEHLSSAQDFMFHFPTVAGRLTGAGALSADQEASLCQLLQDKGVPEACVAQRIQAAISKIGVGVVAQALQSRNPWQSLKQAGGKPGCNFRWVLQDELQRHIETKAQQKFGVQVPRAKEKKQKLSKAAPPSLQVDPQQLLLSPGSFVSGSGGPIVQLHLTEVKAQASGICFCSPQQAAPYLSDGKNLSVDALALLITAPVPPESWGTSRLENLRFPAVYGPTREGILINGAILQLGDEVVQTTAAELTEVECVATITCKLCIYRDETKLPWDRLAESPLRTILQGIPELRVCKDTNCNGACNAFHPAIEEAVEQLFLDVWARGFYKLGGSRSPPAEAEVFQTYVRVPESAVAHMFRVGAAGLYVEPRTADGLPHHSWSVVWLPNHTAAQALHALKTQPKAIALTRLGMRYGVRTKESDEQSVFEALRPTHEFIKLKISAHYRLHPLPHGYQRQSIVQLLRQWAWQARPLQPDRGDSTGGAWLVGAAADPPSLTQPLGTSFVLITKVRPLSRSWTKSRPTCNRTCGPWSVSRPLQMPPHLDFRIRSGVSPRLRWGLENCASKGPNLRPGSSPSGHR